MTVATAWLTGCSGCHVATLDLAAGLEDILHVAEFVFTPLGDAKDVFAADVGLVEGCIATDADEELLTRLRDSCTKLVALGSCAAFGGIPAMRDFTRTGDLLSACYADAPGTDRGAVPPGGGLARLRDEAEPISALVDVEVVVPGCPPTPEMIGETLSALARGELPSFGAKNLCYECDREHAKLFIPHRQFLADFVYAPKEWEEMRGASFLLPSRQMLEDTVRACFELEDIDSQACFLEQGVLCMGPATRQGCGAMCPAGNYPCRGCFGPTPNMDEQGSRIMDALACVLPTSDLIGLEDLVGTGYRFSPPYDAGATGKEHDQET